MKAIILTLALLVPSLTVAYGYTDSYGVSNRMYAGQGGAYAGAMNYGSQNGLVGSAANTAGNTLNAAGNVAGNTLNAAGNVAGNTLGTAASIF